MHIIHNEHKNEDYFVDSDIQLLQEEFFLNIAVTDVSIDAYTANNERQQAVSATISDSLLLLQPHSERRCCLQDHWGRFVTITVIWHRPF